MSIFVGIWKLYYSNFIHRLAYFQTQIILRCLHSCYYFCSLFMTEAEGHLKNNYIHWFHLAPSSGSWGDVWTDVVRWWRGWIDNSTKHVHLYASSQMKKFQLNIIHWEFLIWTDSVANQPPTSQMRKFGSREIKWWSLKTTNLFHAQI